MNFIPDGKVYGLKRNVSPYVTGELFLIGKINFAGEFLTSIYHLSSEEGVGAWHGINDLTLADFTEFDVTNKLYRLIRAL